MSFWNDFTGTTQRRDAEKGYADSSGMLKSGYDTARTDINAGANKASGYLDPYAANGGRANALLGNFLGTNGAGAQSEAFANFQNDPGFMAEQQAGINALDRSATARGGLYSGAAMKGIANYGQQFQRQAFNDRINALSGFSGQGQQAATSQAGIAQQTGQSLGDLSFGFGQQNAANRINLGNAQAASRNVGLQNALNVAGTAAKFVNPMGSMPMPKVA